jgi:hypothetical protein
LRGKHRRRVVPGLLFFSVIYREIQGKRHLFSLQAAIDTAYDSLSKATPAARAAASAE